MHLPSRRMFFGSALAGLAGADLYGAEAPPTPTIVGPTFEPSTLFLTWQRDPTTTMTIQWLGRETDADQAIRYSKLAETESASAKTITKPYVNTDLKVFRCELSGLLPGTEYKFQIGKSFPSFSRK